MTAYGTASQSDVHFNFALALQVARDLYTLAGAVDRQHQSRADLAPDAEKDWKGPHHDTFVQKIGVEATDAATVVKELKDLANQFAQAWSQARGEQDRINFARHVQHEEDNESGWDHAVEFVAGDDDYGDPPGDPPVPSAPDFGATRSPQWSEFGP